MRASHEAAAVLTRHRVYHAVNRRLTIWGVERRLWLFAAMLGAATFNSTGSLVGGLLTFLLLYGLVRVATSRDPQFPLVVARAARYRRRYDAAKYARTKPVARTATP